MTVDTILMKTKPKWCIVMNDNWNNRDRLSFISFTLIVKICYTLHILSWWPDSAKIICTICEYSQNTWNMKHTLVMKWSSQKINILEKHFVVDWNKNISFHKTKHMSSSDSKHNTTDTGSNENSDSDDDHSKTDIAMMMTKIFLMKFCCVHCPSKA